MKMRKRRGKLIILLFALFMSSSTNVSAKELFSTLKIDNLNIAELNSDIKWGNAYEVIPTDVANAGENSILLGVKGSYLADQQSVLDKINSIRKEACEEGVPDPRNSSRNLTPDDYVPIKWSADLEYIARIRAAESSVRVSHTRPNNTSCFSLRSPNGIGSFGEVLAWNYSNSTIRGILQWYEEKDDWVNQKLYSVTGHYTQMIDPSNLYIGVSTFLNPNGVYYNTTAGEFSFYRGLDESKGPEIINCTQLIEVAKNMVDISITGLKDKIDVLEKANADVVVSGYGCKLYVVDNIIWESSDPYVASVDDNGIVTGKGNDRADIIATCGGLKVSHTIEVYSKENLDLDSLNGVEISGRAVDALRINWNKNAHASGYIIEQYDNGSWKRIARIGNGSTTTYRVEGLKGGTNYRFRIRAFGFRGTEAVYGKNISVSGKTNPAVVTGLKIGGTAKDALRLNWSAVSGAEGYIIEKYEGNSWKRVARVEGGNTETYRIEGLKVGTSYQFRIKAFGFDESTVIYSDYEEIAGKTDVENLNLNGVKIGGRAVDALRINWNKNVDASGYIIEQYNNGNWKRIARIGSGSTTTYRVEGLKGGISYQFRIKAFGFRGAEAVYGKYISVSGKTNPAVVTGLKIGGTAKDALRLNWSAVSGAEGYIIEKYEGNSWKRVARVEGGNTETYRIEGLKVGTSYQFRIKAFGFDESTVIYSDYEEIAGKTDVENLNLNGVKIGGRAVDALRINWNKNVDASGYIIEQNQNGTWIRIARIGENSTTTYRVERLTAGIMYQFRICTFVFRDNTPVYGNFVYLNGTTIPSMVNGLCIGGTATDALRLNWNKNTSASGYIIEKYQNGNWVRIARIADNNAQTYRVEGLQSQTTYMFRICTFRFDGGTALYSDYQMVTGNTK